MPTLKYIFFITLVIIVSLFASKNMHTVEIHFIDGYYFANSIKIPVIILIAGSFGLGFLFVWFFEIFSRLKLKTQLHMKDRKIKTLEEDLSKLNEPREVNAQLESLSHTPES